MFLRPNHRDKDGKDHTCWSLVETVRTPDGPRQRTLCYLGELNDSTQARWVKVVEVFNEQGESQQLKLFPSAVELPANDPDVAQVRVSRVRFERMRQFGRCCLGLELWKRLELDPFWEKLLDGEGVRAGQWTPVTVNAGGAVVGEPRGLWAAWQRAAFSRAYDLCSCFQRK